MYVRQREVQRLPEVLLLLVAAAAKEQTFDRRQGLLVRKHKGSPDATVLAVGITTLLYQLDDSQLQVPSQPQHVNHSFWRQPALLLLRRLLSAFACSFHCIGPCNYLSSKHYSCL